ncbi:nitrilase-related carbon-nitrogen hydrolase [Paradesulfitobacterium ferrireducens]|uniref:nitrilase-related carbon-nitrogen hydrolase n=1 Tax=Paradesulfitobacterium ferrireducens TaxID=2816476 RepID=UPI001A8D8E37|nr:nitrilase-related carbon-nitrogen hydrolase [Paradesulfitobacterium ferrireducens]
MQGDLKIGVAQLEALAGESERNLAKILQLAEQAAGEQVSFLCYPEMALHGYAPKYASELAEPLSSSRVRRLTEAASDLNITMLVGMAELSGGSDKPYLAQVLAFPDGTVESYHKAHLGRSEKEYFTAGDKFPVFSSHGVKFAVGICWDWHFPEMAAIYSLKGAELLFAPHASPVIAGDRREIWLRYLGARAYDNSVYLAACNLTGTNGQGREFSGGALILGPKGEILTELSGGNASGADCRVVREDACGAPLLTATLSADRLNTLRRRGRSSMRDSFFLADRRKELYRELIELEVSEA